AAGTYVPGVSEELSHAAANVDRRAGDIAGALACQECDEPGDLAGLAEPAKRHLGGRELAEELLGRKFRRPQAVDVLPLRRLDQADVHAVYQDPFAAELD